MAYIVTESEVHSLLHQRLGQIQGVKLLGWSPPNAKTYGLPNILVPKIVSGRRAGSDRIDACVAYKRIITLVEIKPASSQMKKDTAKLRRICSFYGLSGLVQILRRQGINVTPLPRWLVPVIAFSILDSTLPTDFVCWQVSPEHYQQIVGSELPEDVAGELQELKLSFERTPNSPER